jgi:cold-inducible RNA-binding protein
MPDTNVYVGNLPWGATEGELKDHFSQYGAVKGARIITDRETGKSRGFGFVEFTDTSSAEKALVEDGCDFNGRALRVSLANRQQSGNGGGKRPSNGEKRGPRRSSRPRTAYGDEQ